MGVIRTFIAFETTPGQKLVLAEAAASLKEASADVRWESPDKYHCTLKFLGETEERNLPAIRSIIKDVCADCTPLHIEFDRLGCFPTLREPRVIWAGCTEQSPSLNVIKNRMDLALERFGFEIDRRPFHPHVTLGRVKSERRVEHLISKLETVTFESFSLAVGELLLIKSVLHREGSVYTVLDSFHLGGNPAP